jgi:hypothetical protein
VNDGREIDVKQESRGKFNVRTTAQYKAEAHSRGDRMPTECKTPISCKLLTAADGLKILRSF